MNNGKQTKRWDRRYEEIPFHNAVLCAFAAISCFALAPPSGFVAKPLTTSQKFQMLAQSHEFKERAEAMLEVWRNGPYKAISTVDAMANMDKICADGVAGGPLLEFDYRFLPLGPDKVYMVGKIIKGPLKDRRCYCVLSKTDANNPYQLLDERGFRDMLYVPLPRANVPMAGMEAAVGEYRRKDEFLYRMHLSAPNLLSERIGAAYHIFNSALKKERIPIYEHGNFWRVFMLQTVIPELPTTLQVAIMVAHGLMHTTNLHEQALKTLDQGFTEGSPIPELKESIGSNSFESLDIGTQEILLREILATSRLVGGEELIFNQIFLASPWCGAAFVPGPDFALKEDGPNEFSKLLAGAGLSRAGYQRLAQPGVMAGYKAFWEGMQAKDLTQSAKLHYLVSRMQEDSGLFDAMGASLRFRSIRLVTDVVDPLQKSVDPLILQAREIVRGINNAVHNANSPVATGALMIDLLQISLVGKNLELPVLADYLKDMRSDIKKFGEFAMSGNVNFTIHNGTQARQAIDIVQKSYFGMQSTLRVLMEKLGSLRLEAASDDQIAVFLGDTRKNLDLIERKFLLSDREIHNFFTESGKVLDQVVLAEWAPVSDVVSEESVKENYSGYLMDVKVLVNIEPDVLGKIPEIFVEKEKFMDTVLGQIIRNAGQAMGGQALREKGDKPRKLSLSVRMSEDERNVIFTVEDNGKGIPSSYKHRIFECGFTKGKESGTGFGLDQASDFIQKFGGHINFESVLDKGTTFTISLPTRKAIQEGIIRERADLLMPTQIAVLGITGLLGDGDNQALRDRADVIAQQSVKAALNNLDIDGHVLMETEPRVGRGEVPMDMIVDPLVQTYGIDHAASQGTQSSMVICERGSIKNLPTNLFMQKIIVGKAALGAKIDVTDSVKHNLEAIAEALPYIGSELPVQVKDLKGAVLAKTRHKSLVREMLREGIQVEFDGNPRDNDADFERFWKTILDKAKEGEDVVSGNLTFLAKKDVDAVCGLYTRKIDFIIGADCTAEGLEAAALTEIFGGKMSAQLIPKERLFDDRVNADLQNSRQLKNFTDKDRVAFDSGEFVDDTKWTAKERPIKERKLKPHQNLITQIYSSRDLVNAADLLLVVTAVKDNHWLDELKGVTVDEVTGDKTLRTLVAAKGGMVRIIETVVEGDYLQRQKRIEEEMDLVAKAEHGAALAQLLANDGGYDRAKMQLKAAMLLADQPRYDAMLEAIDGFQLLVDKRGHEAEAIKHLKEALKLDPSEMGYLEQFCKDIAKKPQRHVVEGDNFQFQWDESGFISLNGYNPALGRYFPLPLMFGVTDANGERLFGTDQECWRNARGKTTPSTDEISVQYLDDKKGLALTVHYVFPKRQSFFTVSMELLNHSGESLNVGHWQFRTAEDLLLGYSKDSMKLSGLKTTEDAYQIASWHDMVSRMSLSVAFVGSDPKAGRILPRKGDKQGFLAVANAEGPPLWDRLSRGSDPIMVTMDQSELNTVDGFALLHAMEAVGARRGAVADAKDEFSLAQVLATLPSNAHPALISALLLEGESKLLLKDMDQIPAAVRDRTQVLALAGKKWNEPMPIDAGDDPQLQIFAMELDPEKDVLVGLFNFSKRAQSMDLKFTHLGLPANADMRVEDIWAGHEGENLGEEYVDRVRGNYWFNEIPSMGMKLIRVMKTPKPKTESEKLDEASGSENALAAAL